MAALHAALNAVHWSDATTLPRFSSHTIDKLIERAKAAQAKGDGNAFRILARALGAANTRGGDEYLISVIADESIPLDHTFAMTLGRALVDSEVEGIAELARARYERGIEEGHTSWTGAAGWFDLIAAHGSADDIRYLTTRRHHRGEAAKAMRQARSEPAIDAVVELIRGQQIQDAKHAFRMLLEKRPDVAFTLAEEAVRLSEDQRPYDLRMSIRDVFRSLGRHGPIAALDRIKHLLRMGSLPKTRIEAVYGVEALKRRKLDISDLTAVVEYPQEHLAEVARGGERNLARKAAYAIEYNRVTWSSDALAALRDVAKALKHDAYRQAAAEIAAEMKSPWK